MHQSSLEIATALLNRVIEQTDDSKSPYREIKQRLVKISEELEDILDGPQLPRKQRYPKSVDIA